METASFSGFFSTVSDMMFSCSFLISIFFLVVADMHSGEFGAPTLKILLVVF